MKGSCGECYRRWYCETNPDDCNEWPDPVPMTNADRIRYMTDEELAKHLVDIGWDCHLCAEHRRLDNEPLLRGEKCDEKCAENCLEWLQQPDENPKGGVA